MVISVLKINPPYSKRREAIDLLRFLQGPTRVASGCLDCSLYEGSDNKSILYIEQWRSREELYEHIKSSSYISLLTAMELSATTPEISFVESMATDGLELIALLRSD